MKAKSSVAVLNPPILNFKHNRTGQQQMAKPKQQQLVAIPTNKNSAPSSPDVDLYGEDSWVMVKKQKVTILIPPLPVTKQTGMPNTGESQPQARPRETIDTQSHCAIKTHPPMHSVFEREKSVLLAPEKAIPIATKVSSHPIPTFLNLSRPNVRTGLENPQVDNFRYHRTLGACSISKARKRVRSFLDGDVLLNQRMRALNLEWKLQRAGGLSSWLASLGLDQFVKIFQGKRIGKFQLVNLTMKKLKDMGADAVGPRRKLMHAIDCLCQPYCFETL